MARQAARRTDQTWESSILDAHPSIRARVKQSSLFRRWRSSLPLVEVDGEQLYIRDGDMLKDDDQLIFEWASTHHLLSSQ
jgi:hypothetical protein